jgi:hypothetical protein
MIAIMISLEFLAEFLAAMELAAMVIIVTVPTTAVVIIVTVPTTVAGIMIVDELVVLLVPLASMPSVPVVSFIGERKGWHGK